MPWRTLDGGHLVNSKLSWKKGFFPQYFFTCKMDVLAPSYSVLLFGIGFFKCLFISILIIMTQCVLIKIPLSFSVTHLDFVNIFAFMI